MHFFRDPFSYLDRVCRQGAHAEVVLEVEEEVLVLEPHHPGVLGLDARGQLGQDGQPLDPDLGRADEVHGPVLGQGVAVHDAECLRLQGALRRKKKENTDSKRAFVYPTEYFANSREIGEFWVLLANGVEFFIIKVKNNYSYD